MALNDSAVLAIDSGNYFTAPVGTPLPADLRSPEAVWQSIGHTSLEDIMTIESDGGDAEVLGSLQNRSLRTRRASRTETFAIILQQWDEAGLKLYYGSNSKKLDNGTMSVPNDPRPTTTAFLAIFVDGENVFAFYAPKAEIIRGDDIEFSDTESLMGLPLVVTPLAFDGNDWAYSVTPLASSSEGSTAS